MTGQNPEITPEVPLQEQIALARQAVAAYRAALRDAEAELDRLINLSALQNFTLGPQQMMINTRTGIRVIVSSINPGAKPGEEYTLTGTAVKGDGSLGVRVYEISSLAIATGDHPGDWQPCTQDDTVTSLPSINTIKDILIAAGLRPAPMGGILRVDRVNTSLVKVYIREWARECPPYDATIYRNLINRAALALIAADVPFDNFVHPDHQTIELHISRQLLPSCT